MGTTFARLSPGGAGVKVPSASTVMIMGLAVAIAATVGGAPEDEQPTPRPIGGLTFMDETEVNVVNIDVYVRDKHGDTVTGLGQDDFRIFQDGTEKEITNFALVTEEIYRHAYERQESVLAVPEPEAVVEELPEVRPMYIVLYIDNENIRPLDRNRVLVRVREFVKDNLRPPLQMMVVSYQKYLKILEPFTTDPEAVTGALRSVRRHTGGRQERDSARRDIVDALRQAKEENRERPNSGGSNANIYRNVYHRVRAFADEEANNLLFTVGALRESIGMLAGLPGRKSIIYISDGLPMVPGVDLFYEFASVFNDNSILTQVSRYERSGLFEGLAASANAQGVSFYTVDAQGLQIHGGISAEDRYAMDPTASSIGSSNYQDSLRFMAETTGGLAIINTNDIGPGLERIKADLFTYYSLGYPIVTSGSDKVHRIKVELRSDEKYDVRYRRRFVEKSLESRVRDKVMTGLMFDLDENPMHVEIESGRQAPATSDRWILPIHVIFPLRKVALLPEADDYVGRVVLFVAARDDEGKQSDLQRQEHDIRVPAADYEEAQRKKFAIDVSLLMEAGSYQISVGLMDQVTRQASYQRISAFVKP